MTKGKKMQNTLNRCNHKTNLYHQKISETVEDARIEEGWAHDEYVAMLGVLRYTDDISIDMGLYYSLQAADDYLAQVVRDEESASRR